ncbi:MAG: deoxyguanosinetriphosphate triphosphohydrolase [Chloroflexi bacterium]|nr:deoxyguanosinetriphosphate triphosphohydrolase [Chloroflexota bacterium]
MTQISVRERLEHKEEAFSPYASRSASSRGREVAEPPSPIRTEYQRDGDRILHCKAFRRLKHKTQVFIAPLGDHYVTRLTHTLEVAQISRTIARALNLNEDLTEAIALGHDMGHTPFGHIGEDELNELHPGGFKHSQQSLRIVEQLENEGEGLNLTWEVRHGIVSHSKPKGDFLESGVDDDLTLEGQVCRISDAVAYLNHDLGDAFRAGKLDERALPGEVVSVLGSSQPEMLDGMVTDIIESSWSASGLNSSEHEDSVEITMSDDVRRAVMALRDFMFEKVYIPEDKGKEGQAAREVFRLLYHYFNEVRGEIPAEYAARSRSEDQAVADYISGMTDRFALRMAEAVQPGIAEIFRERLL